MIGPAATPTPLTALQMPIALARSVGSWNTLVMIASVAGKISAAPTPISARPTINASAESTEPAYAEVTPKTTRPTISDPLASVLVAEAAGGEQEPGEHEQVGVDDPLQLAGGGAELDRQRRQRDVDDRAVEHRDEHGEAHDREHRPSARMARRRCRSAPW